MVFFCSCLVLVSFDTVVEAQVHKLVKTAQQDRKNMEADHNMLTSLEQKIASLQVCVYTHTHTHTHTRTHTHIEYVH